ncbi:hypothetical protein AB9K41_01705 [Cribrihabitans sp. XS_ASV171]
MGRHAKGNLILGLCVLCFAALLLAVWIPMDTDSGLILKVRRQVTIGDALAPTVASLFLLVGGAMLVSVERNSDDQPHVSARRIAFVAGLVGMIALSLVVMRYTGPLAVTLFADDGAEYRLLRGTAPWKYIGYFLGGTMMITGMVALVEGRVRLRIALIAGVTVLGMIALYDLPFEDLLLPPNGDV